jgi:hypothetical protein
MRRLVITVSCLAISLSGLMFSPTHAASSFDGKNGTVDCFTDGKVTGSISIIDNVVSENTECSGSLTIPASVTRFDEGVFQGAVTLTSVKVKSQNKHFSSKKGVLFNKNASKLILYPAGKELTNYTIPIGVKTIESGAFFSAKKLTTLKIPASVKKIGDFSFFDATNLTSITVSRDSKYFTSKNGVLFNKEATKLVSYPTGKNLESYKVPTSVKVIGDFSFAGAAKLTEIKISNKTTQIGKYAFFLTTKLKSIKIPASVSRIDELAFYGTTELVTVKFASGSKLKSIGDFSFADAAKLGSINIPANVTRIDVGAFFGTSKLTSITVSKKSKSFKSKNGVLFNKTASRLVIYPAGKKLKRYTVPTSVKIIEDYAFSGSTELAAVKFASGSKLKRIGKYSFSGNTKLVSIKIPASVTRIDVGAFSYAEKLNKVTFLGNAPTVGSDAFLGIASGAKAYVKSTAKGFDETGTPPRWNGLKIQVS